MTWTPQLVEDLIGRQFLHNQDVSIMRPPAPLGARNVNVQQGANNAKGTTATFSDATKQYMKFFNQQNAPLSGNQQPLSNPATPPPQPASTSPSTKAVLNAASPRPQQHQQQPMMQQQVFMAPASQAPTPHAKMVGATTFPPQNTIVPTNVNVAPQSPFNGQQRSQPFSSVPTLQMPPVDRRDCVSACKDISATIQFPRDVPKNSDLMTKPDPLNPGKSLIPSTQMTIQRILSQQRVDPDLIFGQPANEFPLTQIFAAHPTALQIIAKARGESGDWRSDTFTKEEEAKYKKDMGYNVFGPYQARLM